MEKNLKQTFKRETLYGRLPLWEALQAGRRKFNRVYLRQTRRLEGQDQRLLQLLQEKKIPFQTMAPDWFKRQFKDCLTQGWVAEVSSYPYEVDLFQKLPKEGSSTVLVLDQLQDPQNLGSVLRVAEATGVHGVFLPKRHSCLVSTAVSKASAGAAEHLKVSLVANLTESLKKLKKQGYWVVGTELSGGQSALQFDWPERSVLVMGSEGEGLRRLTRETCDFLIYLPMQGKVDSLNVATAASACLYLLAWQRKDDTL